VRLADALGVARLLAAAAFPGALVAALADDGRRVVPLVLFMLAAATDFFDGIVARRTGGPTAHGAVLDNVADIAFVLAGTATAAAFGLVPIAVPAAIVVSVAAYALASLRRTRSAPALTLARSRVGHAAGVLNYALLGLVAIALAVSARWDGVLRAASFVTVAMNVAAVLCRLRFRR
jgi:phosphatidylglycerophosphate synthase